MKIRGKIEIRDEKAPELAGMITQSLEPDNMNSIRTEYGEMAVTTYFESEKMGSLIATVDDSIMNARIAADVLLTVDNKKNIHKRDED
jgi:hypothetical protein